MSPGSKTDAILRAVKVELERQRQAIEHLTDLTSIRLVVKFRGSAAHVTFDTSSEHTHSW